MYRSADRGDKSPLKDAPSMLTCSIRYIPPNFRMSRIEAHYPSLKYTKPPSLIIEVLAVCLILLAF